MLRRATTTTTFTLCSVLTLAAGLVLLPGVAEAGDSRAGTLGANRARHLRLSPRTARAFIAPRPTQLVSGSAAYPEDARAQGIEGLVVVRYDVAVDGRVINARVVRAEPPDVFDDAALASVRSWRFNPALADGVPRATQDIESTVTFKLDGGDEYADY